MSRPRKPRAKSRAREQAETVSAALQQIAELGSKTMFVKVERVMRKASRLDPTQFQEGLYNYIRKRGFVPWPQTLGMHWGMLGGLMCRRLVVETTRDGVTGIEAR